MSNSPQAKQQIPIEQCEGGFRRFPVNTGDKGQQPNNTREIVRELQQRTRTLEQELTASRRRLRKEAALRALARQQFRSLMQRIEAITEISTLKQPRRKYRAYKALLSEFYRLRRRSLGDDALITLPTDTFHRYPNRDYFLPPEAAPILIFQVGKVGSSTLFASLKPHFPQLPVYQIHHIHGAAALLAREEAQGHKAGLHHLHTGCALQALMTEGAPLRWKVIIGVREPIRRWVSEIFQNLNERYARFIGDDGILRRDDLRTFIRDSLETEPMQRWFDEELTPTFGIDLFAHPFDKERGFSHRREGRVELLVYRLEDLPNTFAPMLRTLFPHEQIAMVRANETANTRFADDYDHFIRTLTFERAFLEAFYRRRVVRHFYSDAMIRHFIDYWSTPR